MIVCQCEVNLGNLIRTKVWSEKKYTHISVYHTNLDCLGKKSFKSTKSTHTKDSKLVRQVHIVQRLPPESVIKPKNYFWEFTNFVKKIICKKSNLAFVGSM